MGKHNKITAARELLPPRDDTAAGIRGGARMTDSPRVMAAKRLVDLAKREGFAFQRIAPGEDGPLLGRRVSPQWVDTVYLGGFSESCHATRRRRSSLIVPGGPPVAEQVLGDALTVLQTVSEWSA